jgi:hypothetical protein
MRSTPESIAKRIAEGRGQGTGINYRPWIEVQDFPSSGIIHRTMGLKTGRIHHLLSDFEFLLFTIYDLMRSIIDIREQFPLLPLEETLEIARKIGVKHPTDPATRYPIVMTTDFLLKLRLRRGIVFQARTAKYQKDLDDRRVMEKFEIERRYWFRRAIDWGYVLREKLPAGLVDNAQLVHPFGFLSDLFPLTEKEVRRIAFYLAHRIRRHELPLLEIVSDGDQKFVLPPGKCFSVVCHLIARRVWEVDLLKSINVNKQLVFL